jgi:hypothetical protein
MIELAKERVTARLIELQQATLNEMTLLETAKSDVEIREKNVAMLRGAMDTCRMFLGQLAAFDNISVSSGPQQVKDVEGNKDAKANLCEPVPASAGPTGVSPGENTPAS